MKAINRVVIHCSDTQNFKPISADEIHSWHIGNSWAGIGYHYVVGVDGAVENGRPEYWKGSHVRGYNTNSIGVCLIGRDEFSVEQWASMCSLVANLKLRYPEAKIVAHHELDDGKTCPNFHIPKGWNK